MMLPQRHCFRQARLISCVRSGEKYATDWTVSFPRGTILQTKRRTYRLSGDNRGGRSKTRATLFDILTLMGRVNL